MAEPLLETWWKLIAWLNDYRYLRRVLLDLTWLEYLLFLVSQFYFAFPLFHAFLTSLKPSHPPFIHNIPNQAPTITPSKKSTNTVRNIFTYVRNAIVTANTNANIGPIFPWMIPTFDVWPRLCLLIHPKRVFIGSSLSLLASSGVAFDSSGDRVSARKLKQKSISEKKPNRNESIRSRRKRKCVDKRQIKDKTR